MFTSSRERWSWWAITIVLGLQFRYDFFGFLVAKYKANFQYDSDRLVYSTLSDPDRGLLDPMLDLTREHYESQFGLQGIVMAAVSPGNSLYGGMRVMSALLLAAVVATAVVACRRAWGGLAATVLLVLLAASSWLNAFGFSTYWQVWTMLLPTLVPLLLWPRLGGGRKKWLRGGALIAGLVALKSLCGYEFITAVIAGAVAAVAFHEFRDRFDRALMVRLLVAGTAGVAGFAAALAIHMVQLFSLYGSVSALGSRAAARTLSTDVLQVGLIKARDENDPIFGGLVDGDGKFSLWVFRMIGYLRDPAISLPLVSTEGQRPSPSPLGLPIYLFVIVFVVLAWLAFRDRTVPGLVQRRLAVATGIGFLGALSWMVLAYGHMIDHRHIDAIVFYIPFLPLVFASLAYQVGLRTRRPFRQEVGGGQRRSERLEDPVMAQ